MMKCIVNGRVVLADKVVTDTAVIFDEKIKAIVPVSEVNPDEYEMIDAKGNLVAPGLVDIHIHGYLGEDASDGSEEGLRKMAAGIAANGVTSWCPTTMTIAKDEIVKAFDTARKVKAEKEIVEYIKFNPCTEEELTDMFGINPIPLLRRLEGNAPEGMFLLREGDKYSLENVKVYLFDYGINT